MKRTFFVLSWLAAGLQVLAADYYVSSINPGRSDANPGTSPSAPWSTFDKIKAKWPTLKAGDTVHIERGSEWKLTFSSDYWYVNAGGSASGGPITLRGDDYGSGAKPIPIVHRVGGGSGGCFIYVQRSYVTVRDFVLDGGHGDYGCDTLGVAIGNDGVDISNVTVKNLTIRNLGGDRTKYICGIWITSQGHAVSDSLIEGNAVSDYSAHGLNHYSPGPMINITWRNNIVRNAYTGGRYPSANSGLQITSGSRGCVFEYNYLEDTTTTEGCLLAFGKYAGDTGGNTIRFNVAANSAGFGILFTMDQPGKKLLYDIYGNILVNNTRSGLAITPYDTYAAGTVFNVFNNTFYNNCRGGATDSGKGSVAIDNMALNTTISFRNNLVCHGNYGSSVGLSVDDGFNGSLNHDHNLYWHTGGAAKTVVRCAGTFTPTSIRTFEATAQGSDPLWVDAASVPVTVSSTTGVNPDGLGVQLASKASANGWDLGSSFAQDIDRQSRTPPWSIGAYQAASTSPSDPTSVSTPSPPTNFRAIVNDP